ncbi:hypothetical protein RUM44_000060 [Polyplax serrata]|uniref:CIDE-N domain-containing protein n=1 Tax=Polyplax serrata TaxID=468196 RepID=A0ABR1B4E8_POLSC
MKRGFKVTDKSRTKILGVACNSLKDLLEKGKAKFNIDEDITAALEDGTVVDDEDYFQVLPAQTVVVLYRKNETIITGVDFVLNALRLVNNSYLQTGTKAREVLLNKAHELIGLLGEGDSKNEWKNTREEDPDWFSGLETNARSKDEYMNRKSQDRIRGYLYKFQDDLRNSDVYLRDRRTRKLIQECLTLFKLRLKADGYFGCYFDRRFSPPSYTTQNVSKKLKFEKPDVKYYDYEKFSYCDDSGMFVCQGKWMVSECEFSSEHHINPYSNKKARIIFSTWNLDHRIERSRSVVPAFLKAAQSCDKFLSLNFMYFYQLLFTKTNLKLVHVVCHDKSAHNVSCDTRFIYKRLRIGKSCNENTVLQ